MLLGHLWGKILLQWLMFIGVVRITRWWHFNSENNIQDNWKGCLDAKLYFSQVFWCFHKPHSDDGLWHQHCQDLVIHFPPSLLLFSILKIHKIKYYLIHNLKIYIGNLTWSAAFRKNAWEGTGFNNLLLIFDCQIENENMTVLENWSSELMSSVLPGLLECDGKRVVHFFHEKSIILDAKGLWVLVCIYRLGCSFL